MRQRLSLALLFAFVSTQAAPLEAPTRTFEGRDLFALQLATDPQISATRTSFSAITTSS